MNYKWSTAQIMMDKKFKCESCNKSYTRKSSFTRHEMFKCKEQNFKDALLLMYLKYGEKINYEYNKKI